jgi:hypothetical protein
MEKPYWWGDCPNAEPDQFGDKKHNYVTERRYDVEWVGEDTEPAEYRAHCTTCGDIADVSIFDEPERHSYGGEAWE